MLKDKDLHCREKKREEKNQSKKSLKQGKMLSQQEKFQKMDDTFHKVEILEKMEMVMATLMAMVRDRGVRV